MALLKPLTEKSVETNPKIGFCLTDHGIVTVSGINRARNIYAIDVTDLSIVKYIAVEDRLTGEDVFILAYLSYLYILRVADTRMMRRLTKVSRDTVTKTRDNVFMSFEVVKYKIATLRCVVQRLTTKDRVQIEKNFVDCGLSRVDSILYLLLLDNNDLPAFLKNVQLIQDDTFSLSINSLPKELDQKKAIAEFNKACTYHTWQKLVFIANGNRLDFIDLQRDLFQRAMQAYYWVRPFYTIPHAINYAKLGVHNFANCLIDYYNKDDRARTISTPEGFDNIVKSLSEEAFYGDNIFVLKNLHEDALLHYLDIKNNSHEED